MADLTNIERTKVFDFFQISGGYVLLDLYRKNGKNKTDTRNIIKDSTGIDIYNDEPYIHLSQQQCIEKIIENLTNKEVSNLFDSLFHFFKYYNEDCSKGCHFCSRKNKCQDVQNIIYELKDKKDSVAAIELPTSHLTQSELYECLQKEIKKGNYTLALDRLHTYSLIYLEDLCKSHSLTPNKDRHGHLMLDDMLTKLSRYYKENSMIDNFAETVIKCNKEVVQKFNGVRNNESYTHPNQVMDNNNAQFVVEMICLILRYLESIETEASRDIFLNGALPF